MKIKGIYLKIYWEKSYFLMWATLLMSSKTLGALVHTSDPCATNCLPCVVALGHFPNKHLSPWYAFVCPVHPSPCPAGERPLSFQSSFRFPRLPRSMLRHFCQGMTGVTHGSQTQQCTGITWRVY